MTKSRHPNYLQLRILASKLERNLASIEEQTFLANVLRKIADGCTFDEAIGVKRRNSRPSTGAIEHRINQLLWLTREAIRGGEGVPIEDAISRVAAEFHVSEETVKSDWKSVKARKMRKEFESHLDFPFP